MIFKILHNHPFLRFVFIANSIKAMTLYPEIMAYTFPCIIVLQMYFNYQFKMSKLKKLNYQFKMSKLKKQK
jgi:hypothetical protein